MKKLIIIPIIIIGLVAGNYVQSQIKFSIGPTVGYTSPTNDYTGTTMDFYSGSKYGLNGGVNFGGVFKAQLLLINAKLSLNYALLSNSGSSEPGQGSIETKQKILTIGIGPELYLSLPASPVSPYLGVDLLFSTFTGETTFQGVARVPSGTYSMSSATRTGLGIGAGINIRLGKKSSLDVNARYNLHNLFGKSFTGGNDRLSSYTSLNDDADPLHESDIDQHPIGEKRYITSIQFGLGFLFDF